MRPLRWSVRTRWAAMFGGFFLLAGAALLLINYVLVNEIVPDAVGFVHQADAAPDGGQIGTISPPPQRDPLNDAAQSGQINTVVSSFRTSAMQTLLVASGIALLIAGVLAALVGWLMAGRALRPIHMITATARRLEAGSLDQRINLDGPQDELKELADTFDGMLDRLATAFDSQRRFVANASHELRTPLAVQRTLLEVAMADPTAGPELLRLGQHLLLTGERSERLIEGLLVLARSDRGLLSRVPVRLDVITETVLRSSAGLATEQGVTVSSELAPRSVAGDPILLERLITNLVHNAIHYNTDGGTVRVVVAEHPALMITNTGPVVPAEVVVSLFEPFRRLDRERTAGRNGAGLGLSIARSVAGAHGGTVDAVPNPHGGLTITVGLPGLADPRSDRVLTLPPASAERLQV